MPLASPRHSFLQEVPVAEVPGKPPRLEGTLVGSPGSDIQAVPRRAEGVGDKAVCWDTAPSGAAAGDPNHGTRAALPSAELLG